MHETPIKKTWLQYKIDKDTTKKKVSKHEIFWQI